MLLAYLQLEQELAAEPRSQGTGKAASVDALTTTPGVEASDDAAARLAFILGGG